jgi:hypothetical protein
MIETMEHKDLERFGIYLTRYHIVAKDEDQNRWGIGFRKEVVINGIIDYGALDYQYSATDPNALKTALRRAWELDEAYEKEKKIKRMPVSQEYDGPGSCGKAWPSF